MGVDRRATGDEIRAFLSGGAGVIAATAGAQRDFERRFAPRFNPVSLFARGEVGWSSMFANLLDPRGPHGQGADFFDAFLGVIGAPGRTANAVDVRREATLPGYGQADILALSSVRQPFAWLIENKRGAADQPRQLGRYADYLENKYPQRWCMIYVSSDGGPSEQSLSPERQHRLLHERRLVIVPYTGERSIALWLATCRRECRAGSVRTFLEWMEEATVTKSGDAGPADPTDAALLAYVTASPASMTIAADVARVWNDFRQRTPSRLASAIVENVRKSGFPELKIEDELLLKDWSRGDKSCITLFRPSWPFDIRICLSAASGDKPWLFGISYSTGHTLTPVEGQSLHDASAAALEPDWAGRGTDAWWVWSAHFPEPFARPGSLGGLEASAAVLASRQLSASSDPPGDERHAAFRSLVEALIKLIGVVDAWAAGRPATPPLPRSAGGQPAPA